MIAFGSTFAALPLWQILQEGLTGEIPWPLVAFATLAVPFGLFIIWAGYHFRVWVLPYRFTIDRQSMICGYLWKQHWAGKNSLTGIISVTAEPGWAERSWPWAIYANFADGRKRQCILTSHSFHTTEQASYHECLKIGQQIANHLSFELEMTQWSEGCMSQRT